MNSSTPPVFDQTLLITDTAALDRFCQAVAKDAFLTVDTEFMRERTYFSQLCLIQVAGEHEAAIIDPLAPDIDLSPLWAILRNPKIVKVFHAGSQDLEIFYRLMGDMPKNVVDTQIAAMALGYAEQIGFANLVDMVTGVKIDKTEQFTDWSKRPLRASQLSYALSDVTELRPVYAHMQAELERSGRMEWIADLIADLNDENNYKPSPDDVWQKIKLRSHKPAPWLALKKLAAWREHEAMRANRPRNFIIKDDVLAQIAMVCPKTVDDLAGIRGIGGIAKGRSADVIVKMCVDATKDATPADVPARDEKDRLTAAQEDQLDLLRLALKIMARQLKVVPRLLADSEDLSEFVLKKPDSRLSNGWRWEAFGKQAQALIDGKAAIAVTGIYEV